MSPKRNHSLELHYRSNSRNRCGGEIAVVLLHVSILNLFCRSPCDPNFVDINNEDLELRFEYGYHNIFLYQAEAEGLLSSKGLAAF
ncbi:hypothetical protein QL285_046157 [Trifolium repens]|nr:hypothetical protein QL285_046157 [Trifolium repens]